MLPVLRQVKKEYRQALDQTWKGITKQLEETTDTKAQHRLLIEAVEGVAIKGMEQITKEVARRLQFEWNVLVVDYQEWGLGISTILVSKDQIKASPKLHEKAQQVRRKIVQKMCIGGSETIVIDLKDLFEHSELFEIKVTMLQLCSEFKIIASWHPTEDNKYQFKIK